MGIAEGRGGWGEGCGGQRWLGGGVWRAEVVGGRAEVGVDYGRNQTPRMQQDQEL